MHLRRGQPLRRIGLMAAFILISSNVHFAFGQDKQGEPGVAEEDQLELPEDETPTSEAETTEEIVETSEEKNESVSQEVEVEPSATNLTAVKTCNCSYLYLKPYRERRSSWGGNFSAGVGQFNPTNYKPDFVVGQSFDSYYGAAESPMVDINFGIQKNFSFGSVTGEFGGSFYSNQGKNNTTLKVTPVRAGLKLSLDTLFSEPYIVPYASGGVYTAIYDESVAAQSVKGNTEISFYYTVGSLFQLDWLDQDSDIDAYEDNGIENTFIYLEAQSYMASSKRVPNFESTLQIAAGLKLEW